MKILLVEDNPADARLLAELLRDSSLKGSFTLEPAASMKEALARLSRGGIDLVLLDLMLPDSAGIETFLSVHGKYPDIPVVLLTGLSDENLAATAVKEGAQDYLVKGQADQALLARSLRYAFERHAFEREQKARGRSHKADHAARADNALFPEMVGSGEAISEVKSLIATVAKTSNTSVLITGETGTGKELVANSIHFMSSRRDGPFIKLNCSAIPDTLMEAEMFGYEKGAFTDARQSKKGLFELAHGGTIFLDEIGDMDIRLQPKLLQILENRTLRRVGGVEDIKIDVRVIAATNVDLAERVREKRFREDLLYRINVMVISLPPLRERKGDIVAIAGHFIAENSRMHGLEIKEISPECREFLLKYDWPGNIRELKNVIERAVITAEGSVIKTEHLNIPAARNAAAPAAQPAAGYPVEMSLEDIEKAHIRNVLEKTAGNITHASKILGISRFTLREKIKKFGLKAADL